MGIVACPLHSLGKAQDDFEMSSEKIFGELYDHGRGLWKSMDYLGNGIWTLLFILVSQLICHKNAIWHKIAQINLKCEK